MSRSNWNLEVLVFVEGGKPTIPEKNPWSKARTNNKVDPHETASAGIEPCMGHRGGSLFQSKVNYQPQGQ